MDIDAQEERSANEEEYPKGGYSYLAKVGGGPLHLREVRGTKKEVW
jgi:hypothetical protein